MRFISFVFILSLVGCASTPYNDDYTQHVNLMSGSYFDDSSFKFEFSGGDTADIRGLYVNDNTAVASPMMYQGVGGIAGLIAQVGTHSSIIQSQRNDKLAELQNQANQHIQPLINLSKSISLTELVDDDHRLWLSNSNVDTHALKLKPIFFSNESMSEISLRTIIWLPLQKKRKTKTKFKYKNMVQVYSKKLTKTEADRLVNGDQQFLSEIMSHLLNTTLHITKNEMTGRYVKAPKAAQTFIIKHNSAKKVIRGTKIAEIHDFEIIQDLHSWFIAYPKPSLPENSDNELTNSP